MGGINHPNRFVSPHPDGVGTLGLVADIEKDIDRLYEVPPEEFTARREELAKSLKEQGDADRAKEVKALRKPTVVAWALNQLPRRHAKEVKKLVEAGEALRGAQRKAMSGVKDAGFRDASELRRQAVLELTRKAVALVEGRGGQGAAEKIALTLETASVDEEAAEQLQAGRFSKEVTGGSGFDAIQGFEVIAGGPEAEAQAEADTARREVEAAKREAEKAEAEARRAAMRADTLENDAKEAARRAKEARTQADRLAKAARKAVAQAQTLRGATK